MPQLDLITLSTQISVMFFYGWGLFVIILNLILPQYLILNHSKKIFWFYLNSLIKEIKFYIYLNYAILLVLFDFLSKSLLNKSILIKNLIENFSKYTLNFLKLKINFFLFFEIYFFQKIKKNLFSLKNNFMKKILSKIFFHKSLGNILMQEYILNFYNKFSVTKRQKTKLTLTEMTEFWTLEDKIYIKNKKDLAKPAKKKSIFKSRYIC